MMAYDDLIDKAQDAKRRRDESDAEFKALTKALQGLAEAGLLDSTGKRKVTALAPRRARRRQSPAASA